jgi:hypothetical protein
MLSSRNANVVMGDLGTFGQHSEEGVAPNQTQNFCAWGNAFFTMIGRKCLNLP